MPSAPLPIDDEARLLLQACLRVADAEMSGYAAHSTDLKAIWSAATPGLHDTPRDSALAVMKRLLSSWKTEEEGVPRE